MEWQLPRIYGKDPKSAKEVAQDSIYDFLVGALSGTFGSLASPGNILNYQQPGSETQGQRIVDPTASPWDQGILDALQGVQTPENVTQTREATALDNAILAAMNQNKNTSADVAEVEAPMQANQDQGDTKKSGSQSETVKIVQNLRENIPTLSTMTPTANVSINDVNNTAGRTMAEKARALFERITGIVKRPNFGDIEINKRAIKDDLSHGVGAAKAAVIPAIPSVLQSGIQIDFQENWKGRGYDGYVFAAPITMDEESVYVAAIVRKTSKNTLYLHEVVDSNGNVIKIDDGVRTNPTSLAADSDAGVQTPSDMRLTQSVDSVNRENVGADASTGAAPAGFDPLSHASNQYGAIPPGENPSRVVDIPVSMDGETKVSRFSRTAAEAQITTDEMVGRIEQLVQDGKLSHKRRARRSTRRTPAGVF